MFNFNVPFQPPRGGLTTPVAPVRASGAPPSNPLFNSHNSQSPSFLSCPPPSRHSRLDRSTRPNPQVFGHVYGVSVGDTWATRAEVSQAGVHAPFQAGISGTADRGGAESIVLNGGYPDGDCGDIIWYMGCGGFTDEITGKRSTIMQCNQSLKHGNLALQESLSTGNPVRVVRGDKDRKKSPWAPSFGFRYDGLYKVTYATTITDPTCSTSYKCLIWRLERYPGSTLQIPVRPGYEKIAREKQGQALTRKRLEDIQSSPTNEVFSGHKMCHRPSSDRPLDSQTARPPTQTQRAHPKPAIHFNRPEALPIKPRANPIPTIVPTGFQNALKTIKFLKKRPLAEVDSTDHLTSETSTFNPPMRNSPPAFPAEESHPRRPLQTSPARPAKRDWLAESAKRDWPAESAKRHCTYQAQDSPRPRGPEPLKLTISSTPQSDDSHAVHVPKLRRPSSVRGPTNRELVDRAVSSIPPSDTPERARSHQIHGDTDREAAQPAPFSPSPSDNPVRALSSSPSLIARSLSTPVSSPSDTYKEAGAPHAVKTEEDMEVDMLLSPLRSDYLKDPRRVLEREILCPLPPHDFTYETDQDRNVSSGSFSHGVDMPNEEQDGASIEYGNCCENQNNLPPTSKPDTVDSVDTVNLTALSLYPPSNLDMEKTLGRTNPLTPSQDVGDKCVATVNPVLQQSPYNQESIDGVEISDPLHVGLLDDYNESLLDCEIKKDDLDGIPIGYDGSECRYLVAGFELIEELDSQYDGYSEINDEDLPSQSTS